MKLFRVLPVCLAGAVLFSATVIAEDWREAVPGEPLYEAKQRIERAELEAARDPLETAAIHTRHAERRLEEIQTLSAQGKAEQVEALTEDYSAALTNANNSIDRARSQGQNVDQALQTVESATRKHSEVLTGLLGQVPAQARPGIQRAIEVSERGRATALQQLQSSQTGAAARRNRDEESRRPDARGTRGRGDFDRPGFERDVPGGFDRGRPGGRPGGGPGSAGGPPRGGPPRGGPAGPPGR